MPAGGDVPESPGRCCSSALQVEAGSCQQRTSLFNKSLQEPLLGFAVILQPDVLKGFNILGQFVTLTKLILVED